jgi:hypothetical protein
MKTDVRQGKAQHGGVCRRANPLLFRAGPSAAANRNPLTREIRTSYPLLRGQNRIASTITQTMPQPIHVMFG